MRSGAFNIIIGIVLLAVAMFMFPMVITGTQSIIGHDNITDYTGLDDIAGIAPTIIFLTMIVSAGISSYSGYKKIKSSKK